MREYRAKKKQNLEKASKNANLTVDDVVTALKDTIPLDSECKGGIGSTNSHASEQLHNLNHSWNKKIQIREEQYPSDIKENENYPKTHAEMQRMQPHYYMASTEQPFRKKARTDVKIMKWKLKKMLLASL